MDDRQLWTAALVTVARTGMTLDTPAARLVCNHGLTAFFPWCSRWADFGVVRRLVR